MNPPIVASAPDWAALRADFPILDQTVHGRPLVYLDNGATTQKPRAVIEALVRYYERDNANVHRGVHELSYRATTAYEAARARAARFIHAGAPEEIIFTRGTTEGLNLIAYSFTSRLKPGDAILVTEWSTTAIWCPGSCSPSARERSCSSCLLRAMTVCSTSAISTNCSRAT